MTWTVRTMADSVVVRRAAARAAVPEQAQEVLLISCPNCGIKVHSDLLVDVSLVPSFIREALGWGDYACPTCRKDAYQFHGLTPRQLYEYLGAPIEVTEQFPNEPLPNTFLPPLSPEPVMTPIANKGEAPAVVRGASRVEGA